jgi:hypothetical protein
MGPLTTHDHGSGAPDVRRALALWLMVPGWARWVGSWVDGAGWGASYGRSGTDVGIDFRYLGDRRRGDDRPGGLACRDLRRRRVSDPVEPSATPSGCAWADSQRRRGASVGDTEPAAGCRAASAGAGAGAGAGGRRGAARPARQARGRPLGHGPPRYGPSSDRWPPDGLSDGRPPDGRGDGLAEGCAGAVGRAGPGRCADPAGPARPADSTGPVGPAGPARPADADRAARDAHSAQR